MARIEKMELRAGNISFDELSTLHREDSIVSSPRDQRRRPMFTEVHLPILVNIQISLRVVEDCKLDILVSRPVLVGLVDHPIVRADPRRIADAMQIMPLGSFNCQEPVEYASGILFAPILPEVEQPREELLVQGFSVRLAVLDDHGGHSLGMHDSQPETNRCTYVGEV